MNRSSFDPFKQIKDYARNPLGIIAMFISLIYGFAALLLGLAANRLTSSERMPIVYFIIVFPILILIAFYRLVTKHDGKLYSPSDYKEDSSFLETISPAERQIITQNKAKEVLKYEAPDQTNRYDVDKTEQPTLSPTLISRLVDISKQIRAIEDKVIAIVERELNVNAQRNVRVVPGQAALIVDAAFMTTPSPTFLEIKVLSYPTSAPADSILFTAARLHQFLQGKFRLIIVVVYSFDKGKLSDLEKEWKARIETVPLQIVLRFISRNDLNTTEKIVHQ
jgi:hypothetical protein